MPLIAKKNKLNDYEKVICTSTKVPVSSTGLVKPAVKCQIPGGRYVIAEMFGQGLFDDPPV